MADYGYTTVDEYGKIDKQVEANRTLLGWFDKKLGVDVTVRDAKTGKISTGHISWEEYSNATSDCMASHYTDTGLTIEDGKVISTASRKSMTATLPDIDLTKLPGYDKPWSIVPFLWYGMCHNDERFDFDKERWVKTKEGYSLNLFGVAPAYAEEFNPIKNPYNKSKDPNNQYAYDPLILDLNGDGIKTTTLENGVYFDQSVGWVLTHK